MFADEIFSKVLHNTICELNLSQDMIQAKDSVSTESVIRLLTSCKDKLKKLDGLLDRIYNEKTSKSYLNENELIQTQCKRASTAIVVVNIKIGLMLKLYAQKLVPMYNDLLVFFQTLFLDLQKLFRTIESSDVSQLSTISQTLEECSIQLTRIICPILKNKTDDNMIKP